MPFRCTKGWLCVAAFFQLRISIGLVEQRNDLIDDIKGEFGQSLELSARDGGGWDAAAAGEANKVRHDSPPGLERINEEGRLL